MTISARSALVLAFPFALAGLLVGPTMVRRAEGCAGIPTEWDGIVWPGDSAAPTDAVVVLKASALGWPSASSVALTIKDPSGATVPGSLTSEPLASDTSQAAFALVFKPSAPLSKNTDYAVGWSVTQGSGPTLSGQGKLHTISSAGAPVQAPSVQATFTRVHTLTGTPVHCTSTNQDCYDAYYTFPKDEVEAPSLSLTWTFPPSTTNVYTLSSIEAVPNKGNLPWGPYDGYLHAAPFLNENASATISFSDELPEYCLRLRTRDLRNGSEVVSPDACAPSTSAVMNGTPLLDAELSACTSAPNDPSLFAKWCSFHSDKPECAGVSSGGGGATGVGGSGTGGATGSGATGSGGTGSGATGSGSGSGATGSGGTGSGGVSTGGAKTGGTGTGANSKKSGDASSDSGCSMSGRSSSPGFATIALLALFLLRSRRRASLS